MLVKEGPELPLDILHIERIEILFALPQSIQYLAADHVE